MKLDSIQTIAVLGLGTMGHGIAQSFAAAGYAVCCFDEFAEARTTAVDRIRINLERMADAGIGEPGTIPKTLERITVSANLKEAVEPAQYVVEAIREDADAKCGLFAELDKVASQDTILASNSSSYPITQTAARMANPERAILTHWFNPPHLVPLVEVVPGRQTTEETTTLAVDLHRRIGKLAVRLHKEIPGFLVNRVQMALMREVFDLLERGVASAEDIDQAIRGSMGMRLAALGPLQIIDFAGLDITGKVYQNLVQDIRSDRALHANVQQLIDAGHYGTKAGKGFFDYTPESLAEKQAERDRRYLALLKMFHAAGPD